MSFAVVFFWTPPHLWSLAIRCRDDYAAAGVPMLPAVTPGHEVARRILRYTYITVAVSLLLWPVAGTSWLYPVVALALGAVFLLEAHGLARRAAGSDDVVAIKPMRLFHWSNMYLSLLFLGVALDPLLPR